MRSGLYKTTIVVWSDFDPEEFDIEDLSRDAFAGCAYYSRQNHGLISMLEEDEDWDESAEDFFSLVVTEDG